MSYSKSKPTANSLSSLFQKEKDHEISPFQPKTFSSKKADKLKLEDIPNPNLFLDQNQAWRNYQGKLEEICQELNI